MKKSFKVKKFKSIDIGKKKSKFIYNYLIKNIKNTTFEVFGYNFFLESLKINYRNSFYIEYRNKIVSYVSYINIDNEKELQNILIKELIKNPFRSFFQILINFKFFFKIHKKPKKYIQLLHLIIKFHQKLDKNSKIKLNKEINKLHVKITKSKYKGIYASFENINLPAFKYYKKNHYKIYDKNYFYSFVKKEIKDT
tara:strand:+ start:280 stop:867 length:588 start_codon:yes stop_codon:yes gene_type:complete